METERNERTAPAAGDEDKNVPLSRVAGVVTTWLTDFQFVSLCRHFKAGNLEGFNDIMATFESMTKSLIPKGEKTTICAFLARVLNGKDLDMLFEDDNDDVMPLMSAAKIWGYLEKTVQDESLFKNIMTLLLVQSVAVCLEKGQRSSAMFALGWLESNKEFTKTMGGKMATIVTQGDAYHPLLTSFSFSRLLEAVQTFLDAYLEKNPSDYLLKAATEAVQMSDDFEASDDSTTKENSPGQTNRSAAEGTNGKKITAFLRPKKKLLPKTIPDLTSPVSDKKPQICLKRISNNDVSQLIESKPIKVLRRNKKKSRKKWTKEMDMDLIAGVRSYGEGKWAVILSEYDFAGRTGVMLKDRWRILKKKK